jgi:hypothetical protein
MIDYGNPAWNFYIDNVLEHTGACVLFHRLSAVQLTIARLNQG